MGGKNSTRYHVANLDTHSDVCTSVWVLRKSEINRKAALVSQNQNNVTRPVGRNKQKTFKICHFWNITDIYFCVIQYFIYFWDTINFIADLTLCSSCACKCVFENIHLALFGNTSHDSQNVYWFWKKPSNSRTHDFLLSHHSQMHVPTVSSIKHHSCLYNRLSWQLDNFSIHKEWADWSQWERKYLIFA